jgi:methionine synthase I (cobalamin-dependent)
MADYLEDIVYELNESAKIAREVADEWTAKIQTNLFCSRFNRTNKQNRKYVTRRK